MSFQFIGERLVNMSQTKKKPPILKAKEKETVNKKALIWIAASFVVLVALITVLLLLDK